jgi:uncharacterized membrane protein (DUF2068 family)
MCQGCGKEEKNRTKVLTLEPVMLRLSRFERGCCSCKPVTCPRIWSQLFSTRKIHSILFVKTKGGLRIVSVFEAVKGSLVLLLSLSLYTFAHRDYRHIVSTFEKRWHVDMASHIPEFVQMQMQHLTDARLHFVVFLAALYALMRYVEAYGLWFQKRWAEWFALLSGGVYLPVELYELAKGVTPLKAGLLAANLLIVIFMAVVLISNQGSSIQEA